MKMKKILLLLIVMSLVSGSFLFAQQKNGPVGYCDMKYDSDSGLTVASSAEVDTVRATYVEADEVLTAPPFEMAYIGWWDSPPCFRVDTSKYPSANSIVSGHHITIYAEATHPSTSVKYSGEETFTITATSGAVYWMFPPYGDAGIVLSPMSSDPDTVTVVGESLTSTSCVAPGTDNVPMVKLTLSTNANDAQWTAVKVDNRCDSYTTYASDIDSVKVYKDNGDGTFDPATDTLIGQNSVTDDGQGGTSTITFGSAETITTTAGIYFIAYDIASTADPSHWCGAKLADNSYITVESPDVVSSDNFPIQADCQCLPVELAAFTATYVADYGYISLSWVTASETDVQGFNIHRNTEDDFSTSDKLNASLIAGHGTSSDIHKYEFTDDNFVNFGTTYYYWLESVDLGGMITTYGSYKCTPEEGPGGFEDDFQETMLSNYPNPFTGRTTIKYGIKGMLKAEPVEMSIYNIAGQLVDLVEARDGIFEWDARDFAAGIYFCRIKTENYSAVKKMMILK